ncbi:MAG: DUF4198 domain-containing protein [Alphaproteobacteria bacterium]
MSRLLSLTVIAAALLFAMASGAHAHRAWLLPSATVLSGEDPWITVDAAISNDLFYFEHHPMRLDGLAITAPDGSETKAENISTGKYRSTFDVHLSKPGTYRIAVVSNGVFARFMENGKRRRLRGRNDQPLAIPPGATDVHISAISRRMEAFATAGGPTREVLKPTGIGLELVPLTHPNDLFAGEAARFQFLIDGEPAAGLAVAVIPGGIRYRDKLKEMKITTGSDGKFSVTWPAPGMYWLNATIRDDKPKVKQATERRAGYTATLEVLPQ